MRPVGMIEPVVRQMILCEEAERDPENPNRINIMGLMNVVIRPVGETLPVLIPQIAVYLLLAGGRGPATVSLAGHYADTDRMIFETAGRTVNFGNDPLRAHGLIHRVRDVRIVRTGLYWIRFRYNGRTIAEQLLEVR